MYSPKTSSPQMLSIFSKSENVYLSKKAGELGAIRPESDSYVAGKFSYSFQKKTLQIVYFNFILATAIWMYFSE